LNITGLSNGIVRVKNR